MILKIICFKSNAIFVIEVERLYALTGIQKLVEFALF